VTSEELTAAFFREVIVLGEGEDRWIVGELDDFRTVVGTAREGELCSGEHYRFLGTWVEHPRFGKQFKFSSFAHSTPISEPAIERYLQRYRGIGQVGAKRIVQEFGEDSLDEIRTDPGIVAERCDLSREVCRALSEQLQAGRRIEKLTMAVDELLHGIGFPKSLNREVIDEWGERAPAMIRESPFCLRVFKGCGFKKCDALWQRLGKPLNAPERQMHCAAYAVESDTSGSTWVAYAAISRFMVENMAGGSVDKAIASAIECYLLIDHIDRDGTTYYALTVNAEDEASYVSDLTHAHCERGFDEYGL